MFGSAELPGPVAGPRYHISEPTARLLPVAGPCPFGPPLRAAGDVGQQSWRAKQSAQVVPSAVNVPLQRGLEVCHEAQVVGGDAEVGSA
jgi:hypothetical protein